MSSLTSAGAATSSSTPAEAPASHPVAVAEVASSTPTGSATSSTTPAGSATSSSTPIEMALSSTPMDILPGMDTARLVSWISLTDDEEDEDDVLASHTPPSATKSSFSAALLGTACDADACGGWNKVLTKCNVQHPTSLATTLAPCLVPTWLHSRCYTCLLPRHRAAMCRDPFRCFRCVENGHRAHECRNSRGPLGFLESSTTSSLSCLPVGHQQAPAPRKVRNEASPLVKTYACDSWASIVAAPAGSVTSTDIPVRTALERQTELFHSELLVMASFRLEEAVQPLCDVIDSMQCWMLRMKNFIERAEDAPGGLYQALLLLHTLVVPEGNFEVERRARLHGRLSPRAGTSSLLSASKGLNKYVVVTRVLQMMPELQDLCGDPVQPSVEQLRVVPDRSRL
ncbi:hypothetical protein ZWY2020_022773 [Hordeum vulgare]|nr:hypothetical protein ZWY2020_022773 [Hordeum vulgare]